MKMQPGIRVSAGINLALLAAVALLFSRERPAPSHIGRQAVEVPAVKPPATAATEASGEGAPPLAGEEEGSSLTAEVMTRFEQAGISRHVLVDIVRLDQRRRLNERMAELAGKYAPGEAPPREYAALERAFEREQIRALEEALGEEGYLAWDKEETLRRMNGEAVSMDSAEADRAYRLQKQFDEKLHELQLAVTYGDADAADMSVLQYQAQDAFENGLKELLGEERYNQLKGYTFPVVEGHIELNALNVSDEQAGALRSAEATYRARETELAQQLRKNPSEAIAVAAELKTLHETREENFRQAVGAEIYDALKREFDPTYQTLEQYAPAWQLQETEIGAVYQKLRVFHESAGRLKQTGEMIELGGKTADWKAIEASIEQARQDAEGALLGIIGADRLHRLKRNGLLTLRR